MARYQWGILCAQVIIDQYTNNASYINAIEEITPEELPAETPNFFVGTVWRREEVGEKMHHRVVVKDPNGEVAYTGKSNTIDFQDNKRFRQNTIVGGVEIRTPGIYEYVIQYRAGGDEEWSDAASLPLEIAAPESRTESSAAAADVEDS